MSTASSIRAGAAYVELFIKDQKFVTGLKSGERKLKDFGNSVASIGGKIAGAFTPVAAVAALGVKAFATYESELANLRLSVNPTAEQFERLKTAIEGVSKSTGIDKASVAQSFTELIKAGTDVETALGGAAEVVVKFSKVAKMSTAEAAVLVSDVLHIFAREGLNAADAVDILSQAADSSSIDLRDISQAFAMASAVAGSTNQSFKDLAAAIGIMGNAGVKGSDAGTALKTMLLKLAAPVDEAKEIFDQYGLSVRNADGTMKDLRSIIAELQDKFGGLNAEARDEALRKLFGSDAIRPALIFLEQGVEGWDKFAKAMNGGLSISEKFGIAMDTTEGRLTRLFTAANDAGSAIGESLAPTLEKVSKWLTEASYQTAEWIRSNGELVATAATIAGAIAGAGASMLVFGKAVAFAGALLGPLATLLSLTSKGLLMLLSPLKMAAIAVEGLTTAFAFLAANPVWLAIAAGAVAVGVAVYAIHKLSQEAELASDKMAKLRAENERMRDLDANRAKRLEELSKKQKLTTGEQIEAKVIVSELSKRYGDLGVKVDELSGKLEYAAKQQTELNSKMEEARKADMQKELEAIAADRERLTSQIDAAKERDARRYDPTPMAPSGVAAPVVLDRGPTVKEIEEKLAELAKRERELNDKLGVKPAQPGKLNPAIFEPIKPLGVTAPSEMTEEEKKAAQKAADYNASAAYKLHEIRLSLIQNEYQREVALINLRYAKEAEEAKKVGGDLFMVEKQRQAELQALATRRAREAADKRKQMEDQIAGTNLEADFARRGMSGTLEEDLAKLRQERQQALRDAAANNEDPNQVNRLFDARENLARIQGQKFDTPGPVGTFSGRAAGYLGLGSANVMNRVATATERTATATEAIRDKTRKGGMAYKS